MFVKLIIRNYLTKCIPKIPYRTFYVIPKLHQQQNPVEMGDCKGVQLQNIVSKLEEFAPRSLAENWDNVGLLIEPTTILHVSQILLTNDLTEDVMEEAMDLKTNLIITYHPHIFVPLKTITNKSWKERITARCLENRIAVYSPHTTWDGVRHGVGDWLAESLPNVKCSPIIPGIQPDTGMGRICKLEKEMLLSDAVDRIKMHIRIPHLRLALAKGKTLDDKILTMAVCPGSGTSVLRGVKADLYLTGEMFHHDVLEATQNGSHVILCNHSDSERGYLRNFATKMREWFPKDVNINVSKRDTDPLKTV